MTNSVKSVRHIDLRYDARRFDALPPSPWTPHCAWPIPQRGPNPSFRPAGHAVQYAGSAPSVDVVAVPAMATKLNGGRPSSQNIDTLGSRRIAFP